MPVQTDKRKSTARNCVKDISIMANQLIIACAVVLSPVAFGQDKSPAVRRIDAGEIAAPPGYRVQPFAANLSFPVDITFSDQGDVYVAEAGGHTYGTTPKKAPPAQILQIMPDGAQRVVYDKLVPLKEIRQAASSQDMPEGLIPPVTGVTWHDGKLYVSHRSRYSVLDPKSGRFKTIVNGLPCWGEFLNAKPIFGPDGKMVFFISTQGNSGVIEKHWMKVINVFNKKKSHEIPGEDVELAGKNFPVPVEDPSTPGVRDTKMTGVYVPLGEMTKEGKNIKGQKICNGAFFRCNPDGSNIERIAWGFRSSFGYRFSPDGRLICTQNGANPMPPRGLWFDFETIYEVIEGEWYGWPDYFSGIPITNPRFHLHKGEKGFVLSEQTRHKLLKGRRLPRQPLVRLPVHSAAQGMVFGRAEFGMDPEEVLVAEMGAIVPLFKGGDAGPSLDQVPPDTAPADVEFDWPGFRVQRVSLETGRAVNFLINKSRMPATAAKPNRPETGRGGGLERPIQLEWGPDQALYVVDFGVITFDAKGMKAHGKTGAIWKVTRGEASDRLRR